MWACFVLIAYATSTLPGTTHAEDERFSGGAEDRRGRAPNGAVWSYRWTEGEATKAAADRIAPGLPAPAGFFLAEAGAVALAIVWALGFTVAILGLIDRITPVRVDEAAEVGLDEALHGEQAYVGVL